MFQPDLNLRSWIRGHGRGRRPEVMEAIDVVYESKQSYLVQIFYPNHLHIVSMHGIRFISLPHTFIINLHHEIQKLITQ